MPAKARIRHEYQAALAEIARRIAGSLRDVAPQALPIPCTWPAAPLDLAVSKLSRFAS